MSVVLNPFTGKFDFTKSVEELQNIFDLRYLTIDQTVVQNIINGNPQFDEGIRIKTGKRLYLDGQ